MRTAKIINFAMGILVTPIFILASVAFIMNVSNSTKFVIKLFNVSQYLILTFAIIAFISNLLSFLLQKQKAFIVINLFVYIGLIAILIFHFITLINSNTIWAKNTTLDYTKTNITNLSKFLFVYLPIALIAIYLVLNIINIALTFANNTNVVKPVVQKQQNVSTNNNFVNQNNFSPSFQNQANLEADSQNEPEPDLSFTSTPNDETFNIADKIQKLRNNLAENDFENMDVESQFLATDEVNESEEQQVYETQEHEEVLETPVDKSESIEKEIVQEDKYSNTVEEYLDFDKPKDPYKQTIIPRRLVAQKASLYKQPIGNVVNNIKTKEQRERKEPRIDLDYEGKVFLGDGDRIWEVIKNQKRRVSQKNKNSNNLNESFNVVDKLQREKTKTLEIDVNKIFDPINDDSDQKSTTIEWDD
ncbi:APC family permease [Spiroplasma gladiatoris]|uniref:APC family permease n=1 Tax=Spiroplasma gladiatoris TaxID=2143 RepID=A0A4P7AJW5_9MOLU|nr:APC family permease [Spiroplasma gladiatoris]QBQ07966.1 APC family permease [Spiroplasma gladiatoris]